LEFQGKQELWNNFGEPDYGPNSFVNNLYPGDQSKKFFYQPLEGENILAIPGKIKIQIH